MKKILIAFTSITFYSSCSQAQEQTQKIDVLHETEIVKPDEIDSANCGLNFIPKSNYKSTKTKIKELRNNLSASYKSSYSTNKKKIIDSAKSLFTRSLLNEIIPYWYGTEWDFNGYTSKPKEGKIACGYFVSTTLRDMGLNLNRYDLAKKGPEDEAKSIAISQKNLLVYTKDESETKLDSIKDGLYFIGLDNHVGYLYKHNIKTYFIHSNYLENKVMIELTQNSEAFVSSVYYIANIYGNEEFIENWLIDKPIKIYSD